MKQTKQINKKKQNFKKNVLKNKQIQKTKKYQGKYKQNKVYHSVSKPVQKHKIKQKKTKRIKIRYGRILLLFLFLFICMFLISKILEVRIQNIYINGNNHLSDQEIIELAQLENYPSYFKTLASDIKKRLEKDSRIESVKIKKKKGKEIYLTIKENVPLYYNQNTKKTVLFDLRETEEMWNAPVLLNYIPDTIYEKFQMKMKEIDSSILERVSEIMYHPTSVDEERFLFTMRDGNYVYLTLETFENINNYVSIYAEFTSKHGNKKGILNLDSGQFFTILE